MITITLASIRAERMEIAFDFAKAFTLVALPIAAFAAVVGGIAWGLSAAMLAGSATLFVASLLIAGSLVWAMLDARKLLTQVVADHLETQAAHRNVMQGATVVQTNINTGDGIIKPKINAPKVTVMGKRVTWNQLNAIQTAAPQRIEIPRDDVLWMLEQFIRAGHSRRTYAKETLPYSSLPAYPDLYRTLVETLVAANAIVGRREGSAGRLVVKDISDLAKIVDGAHPKGVVLELPATTETQAQ